VEGRLFLETRDRIDAFKIIDNSGFFRINAFNPAAQLILDCMNMICNILHRQCEVHMTTLRAIAQPLPLTRLAYEALRDSILTGKLTAGKIYNEMQLSKELGISRTPVREALLELSVQGLITFLPRKGLMVNYFTKTDVEEVFELRKAIELAAVEKVVKNLRSGEIERFKKIQETQIVTVRKKNYLAYMESDRSFHALLGELTRNNRLMATLDNIRDIVHLMGLQALSRKGRSEEVIVEHQEVVEAIIARDPIAAKEKLGIHLDRSREAVLEQHAQRGNENQG